MSLTISVIQPLTSSLSVPLCRIRTYEHEAEWGKALSSYDLHSSLPEVTRQVGIVEVRLDRGSLTTRFNIIDIIFRTSIIHNDF